MSFNQNTIQSLVDAGVLTQSDVDKLQRKAVRIQAKAGKAARAETTLGLVRVAFNELTAEGAPTQHRAVWNKVGRTDFERDEVLNALKSLRDSDEARTYKLSNNNFQVFWAQPVPEVTEDESGLAVIPGVDEV
ncbi:MAG TPA: hypothetical protein EYQ00_10955 [Dehalococcoidia bacterium]|jgi:hypothetical protein|nr:hypothetical protein [Dehalococcoidia bacterium]